MFFYSVGRGGDSETAACGTGVLERRLRMK